MVNCISCYHSRTIGKANLNGTIADMDCVCTVSYHGGIGVAGMTICERNNEWLKRKWRNFIKGQVSKHERQGNYKRNSQDAGQTAEQGTHGNVQRVLP